MPFLAIVLVGLSHICADATRARHLGEIATNAERSHDAVDLINLDSAELQAKTARGFALKELLREDSKNEALLQEYSKLLGEVEYSCETENNLLTPHYGSEEAFAKPAQPAKMLGEAAVVGEELLIRQVKPTRKIGRFFARVLTKRHDYAVEQIDAGKANTPKFGFTGKTWSLHGRMHFGKVGEDKPTYVVRRAYAYSNPIARILGQYVYRVIPFDAEQETGRKAWGKYASDKVLYTITKDRFGKGILWRKEEWRIYTGDGGCKRYGVTSCDPSKQVYYAMTRGTSKKVKNTAQPDIETDLAFRRSDAQVYKGQIESLKKGFAFLSNGSNITKETLGIEYKVAEIVHTSGLSRNLGWANYLLVGFLPVLSPIWTIVSAAWADKYKLQFKQDTDEILMTMLATLMDVTHDDMKDNLAAASGGQR